VKLAYVILSILTASGLLMCSGENGSPQNTSVSPPVVLSVDLVTPHYIDSTGDPRGGLPVRIVADQAITIEVKVEGVEQVILSLGIGASDTIDTETVSPRNGLAIVRFDLPDTEAIYLIQGSASGLDGSRIPIPAIRVSAR
jgi:hypothetical protein